MPLARLSIHVFPKQETCSTLMCIIAVRVGVLLSAPCHPLNPLSSYSIIRLYLSQLEAAEAAADLSRMRCESMASRPH